MSKKRIIFLAIVLILVWAFIEKPFYTVPVLKYHGIDTPNIGDDTPKVSVENFEKQLAFIHRMGYKVITLEEYVKSVKEHTRLKNAVVITFDDGYVDNYSNGLPILKKYGFPAAIFLIEEKIDKNQRFLNLKQIKEMEKNGITFGSHTISHRYLPGIKNEGELRSEIFGSKALLEKRLTHKVDYFVYPIGGFNAQIKELVEEAGYLAAFTTNRGPDKFNRDIYAIRRIKISDRDRYWWTLWFKLSGYYMLFQGYKNPD